MAWLVIAPFEARHPTTLVNNGQCLGPHHQITDADEDENNATCRGRVKSIRDNNVSAEKSRHLLDSA